MLRQGVLNSPSEPMGAKVAFPASPPDQKSETGIHSRGRCLRPSEMQQGEDGGVFARRDSVALAFPKGYLSAKNPIHLWFSCIGSGQEEKGD